MLPCKLIGYSLYLHIEQVLAPKHVPTKTDIDCLKAYQNAHNLEVTLPLIGTSTKLRFCVAGPRSGHPNEWPQSFRDVDACFFVVNLAALCGRTSDARFFRRIVNDPLYLCRSLILVFHHDQEFRRYLISELAYNYNVYVDMARANFESQRPRNHRFQNSHHHLVEVEEGLVPEVFFHDIARMMLLDTPRFHQLRAAKLIPASSSLPFLCKHTACTASMPSLALDRSLPGWR